MKNIFTLCFLFLVSLSYGQKEIWSLPVSKHGFMNQLKDGKIFLKDQKEISLIDEKTGNTLWTNSIETDKDPVFLNNMPIMYIDGKSFIVIDASTGKVIDKSSEKTEVTDVHYYWDKGRVLLELSRDKEYYILNINLNDVANSWTTKVGKMQKMMMGLLSRGTKSKPSIAEDGTLIMVDKDFISLIDKAGNLKDRIEFKDGISKEGYNAEKNILYVLEDKKNLHFVDIASTKSVSSVKLDEKKPQLIVLDNGNTIGIIQKKDCLILDAANGSEKGKHGSKDNINAVYYDSNSGKYLIASKKSILEINQTDGSVVNEVSYDFDVYNIQNINEKLIITGRGRVNEIDPQSLSPKYKESPAIGYVQNFVELGDKGRFYTNKAGEKFTISVVDNSGEKLWSKEFESISTPSVDHINDGLLIIHAEEAHYLSIDQGKSIWKKTLKTGPSFAYAVNKAKGEFVIHSDKKLYFFNTVDGSLSESDAKYKFKDFDYDAMKPVIKIPGDKVFLKGSNSIFITDMSGNIVHEKHYKKADNTSALLKLANVAAQAAVIGSGNAHEVMTVYQGDEMVYKGSMVDDMNDSWAAAERAAFERRQKQNKDTGAFTYVFTKLESGPKGIIMLNTATGEETMEIEMDEKDPNYILDDAEGVFYYLNKSNLKAIKVW